VLRLRIQAAAALVLVAALLVGALTAFSLARSDLDRLASVSEPRAVAAADLSQALADQDAQHADTLVVGYASTPPAPGQQPTLVADGVLAELTAQADRRRISADLAVLAASYPAGSAGDRTVQGLLNSLSLYDTLSGTSEFSATSQQDPVVGRPPELALDYYDLAEGQLQQTTLPQAAQLLAQAQQQVAADGGTARRDDRLGALLLGLLGLATLALLLRWQRDLARRHRRVLNPALLLATACVLAVLLSATTSLLGAADQVATAVDRGYAPYTVAALGQVEAANAEASESRWLVDDAYRVPLQQTYTGLMDDLERQLAGQTGDPAVARTRTAYLAADARLRQYADAGQLDQASVQLTGVTRGEVAFASYDFSTQLGRLAQQGLQVVDVHLAAAGGDLSGWVVLPSALLGAALVLVLVGVRPRLAEFA